MSVAKTSIEWTEATWSPVRGCSRISEGCRNCYAERMAARFSGPGLPYEGLATIGKNGPRWTGEVRLVGEQLAVPLRWRRPRRIFVNSMSDLFHENLSDEAIDRIFGAMWACLYLGRGENCYPGHIFQILTKRADRMRDYMNQDRREAQARFAGQMVEDGDSIFDQTLYAKGPHPRIWLGVSVEDQAAADERIPHLLATPAAVRFLSVEPMLGPVDLRRETAFDHVPGGFAHAPAITRLDWVICGGESGPGARPMWSDWPRALRDQCSAAGVPFFFKQWGEFAPDDDPMALGADMKRFGKKAAGRELDGVTWSEFPR